MKSLFNICMLDPTTFVSNLTALTHCTTWLLKTLPCSDTWCVKCSNCCNILYRTANTAVFFLINRNQSIGILTFSLVYTVITVKWIRLLFLFAYAQHYNTTN